MRKKPGLNLNRLKRRKIQQLTLQDSPKKLCNLNGTPFKATKRKLTPFKSPLKTPFKSPLYKSRCVVKTSRSLFASDLEDRDIIGTLIDTAADENSSSYLRSTKEDKQCDNSVIELELTKDKTIDYRSTTGHDTTSSEGAMSTEDVTSTDKWGSSSVSGSSTPPKHDQLENKIQGSIRSETDIEKVITEIMSLVPEVVTKLSKADNAFHVIVLEFFRQIKSDIFPLENIAFLLWTEVVRWYSHKSTKGMRYSETTKLFWKLGWRMFGRRFVHFMCGFKNQQRSNIDNETQDGCFDPAQSRINFVIPDLKVIRECTPYTDVQDRTPGFYGDIMLHMGKTMEQESACITFDGKKIKQGLTPSSGDVDLLGFDETCSLQERIFEIQSALTDYETFINYTEVCRRKENIKSLSPDFKKRLKNILLKALHDTSLGIIQAKALKKKKEYAKEKLIEKGGGSSWKESKFAYAISATLGFLHDCDKYLRTAEECLKNICLCLSSVNKAVYCADVMVNLNDCVNYLPLDRIQKETGNSRHIQQRTEEWFEIRKQAKVTGSSLNKALGLDGLQKQKDFFDHIKCNLPEKEVSETARRNMEHGTLNEENAVATIVSKIMPVLSPELIFCEEGCVQVYDENGNTFLVVSPDGSLRENSSLQSSKVAVEKKCPVFDIYTEFPHRYYLQCQAEIDVLNVEWLLFVCWTENLTSAFRVLRDKDTFQTAMRIAMKLYNDSDCRKPTKIDPDAKKLKEDIQERSKNVELIGLFPSAKSNNLTDMHSVSVSSIDQYTSTICDVKNAKMDLYELCRQRASEAVVFLCTDLNRSWNKEELKCAPVAWFPKGYSLKVTTMRHIAEHVHNMCHDAGVHVPCESFDGQWHNIVVRSLTNDPLTILQLQKDVWADVQKMKKQDIIAALRSFNRKPEVKMQSSLQESDVKIKRVFVNGITNIPSVAEIKTTKQNNDEETALADGEPLEDDEGPGVLTEDGLTQQDCLCDEVDEGEEELPNESQTPENMKEQVQTYMLSEDDASKILMMLRMDKSSNSKKKWDSVSTTDLIEMFKTTESISKLLNSELSVILQFLKKMKKTKDVDPKETKTKYAKVVLLANVFNLQAPAAQQKRKSTRNSMKSLSELSLKVLISTLTKHTMNRIYAELIWPEKYQAWVANGPTKASVCLDDKQIIDQWFYIPEYSERRGQLEVRCIDATHLLTRTRRKSCRGGLDNSSKSSWLNVAKTGKTKLTPIMIEEISEPMSAAMATTHFSEEVENEMRLQGDNKTADLCQDIRLWWYAEDKAGISAKERVQNRSLLRERLLGGYDFGSFPPATMYVNGWPIQLWEALIAHIDAKALLYALCHGGTYNVRAFSSLAGETFFSELSLNDKRGQGTVTTEEFGQFVGNSIEQMQARLDPTRFMNISNLNTCVRLNVLINANNSN